jgi:thiosulfate/3-mercaptopyruvate sulfurtransferase
MLFAPLFFPWRRAAAALLLACALAAPARAAGVEPLVSPQWLKAHLGDPAIVVLDIRSAIDGGGKEAYVKGHIAGAVHSDYDKGGWRVTRGGVPFRLPTVAELEKLIGEAGIDEDNHVVIVPAGVHATDFGSAARVYWTLKLAGLSRVSILDGGYAAWKADARNPIATGVKPPEPKIYTVNLDKKLIADLAAVEDIARDGGATLVDARPPSFYSGKEKAPYAKVYGHIPGALSLDSELFYDAGANRLKPRAELARIAAAVPAGPVVNYCNTGHWAATDWFVLSELLGRKDVRLYDGSMAEWSAAEQRPVTSSRTRWDDLMRVLGLGT